MLNTGYFTSLHTLKEIQQKILSSYSYYNNDTQVRINKLFGEASLFFTAESFNSNPDYFKDCFESILVNFNTKQLSRSLDLTPIYGALTQMVYQVLSVSQFDNEVLLKLLQNPTNIKLSRVVGLFDNPDRIHLLIDTHRKFSYFSISDYQPALNSSKVRAPIQVRLAYELLTQMLEHYNSIERVFPSIDEFILISKRHDKYIKKNMPDYIDCILSLYSNVHDYGAQISKTKQKKYLRDITNIGTIQYGDRFKPALDIATSLSLADNIHYWRSLNIKPAVLDNYSDIEFV